MEHDLSRSLHTLTARLDRAADQILRVEAGLSYSRFLALFMIGSAGPGTQRALADRLGVTEPSVSRMTRALEEAGLVEAVADPAGGTATSSASPRPALRLSRAGVACSRAGSLRSWTRAAFPTGSTCSTPSACSKRSAPQDPRRSAALPQTQHSRQEAGDDMSVTSAEGQVLSADGTPIAYQSLGAGDGVIVVGGALAAGRDYLPLARALARSFAVHVVDRRGRGASGPQGSAYSIGKECEDLLAVQAATGATAVFGHSYGGLVALETARRTEVFSRLAVYEPGVSVGGSIPVDWMPRYRELLAAGDTQGAFACMVRRMAAGPAPVARVPLWYLRAILRLMIRGRRWQHMEPLLASSLAEHEQVARLDDGSADRYRPVTARVLLLGGQKTAASITARLFDALQDVIADCAVEMLHGLDHNAPTEKGAEVVGDRVRRFLSSAE